MYIVHMTPAHAWAGWFSVLSLGLSTWKGWAHSWNPAQCGIITIYSSGDQYIVAARLWGRFAQRWRPFVSRHQIADQGNRELNRVALLARPRRTTSDGIRALASETKRRYSIARGHSILVIWNGVGSLCGPCFIHWLRSTTSNWALKFGRLVWRELRAWSLLFGLFHCWLTSLAASDFHTRSHHGKWACYVVQRMKYARKLLIEHRQSSSFFVQKCLFWYSCLQDIIILGLAPHQYHLIYAVSLLFAVSHK